MLFLTTALSILLALAQASPVLQTRQQSADVTVLKFATLAEALESQFYVQGLAKFSNQDFQAAGFVSGQATRDALSIIAQDELTHLNTLRAAIPTLGGSTADIDSCQFNFDAALKDVATFLATARVLEFVGVSAYEGGSTLISDKSVLLAAVSIHAVEARHSTTLNTLNGTNTPALGTTTAGTAVPSPFDMALSPTQVLALASPFVSGGCDPVAALGGIPIGTNLAITNTGKVSPGTLLTFSATTITGDTSALFCNMILGGATVALAFPLSQCIVPAIDGPVYIYVTNTSQPLANNINNQNTGSIVAGPTLAFIDTLTNQEAQLLKVQNPQPVPTAGAA